jgi:uncharacterized protein DUF4282
MFDIRDMFQWHRFITPSVVPLFFWVATAAAVITGLFGFAGGVLMLLDYPLVAIAVVVLSTTVTCLGVLAARLIAEFVLITFRTNDHIYAIRVLAEPANAPHARNEASLPHAA